jgi:hypothetical protein
VGLPTSLMSIPARCRESNTLSSSPREASIGRILCVQKLSMHSCFTARASHFFKADLKVVVPTPMPSKSPVPWSVFARTSQGCVSDLPKIFFTRWTLTVGQHGQRRSTRRYCARASSDAAQCRCDGAVRCYGKKRHFFAGLIIEHCLAEPGQNKGEGLRVVCIRVQLRISKRAPSS